MGLDLRGTEAGGEGKRRKMTARDSELERKVNQFIPESLNPVFIFIPRIAVCHLRKCLAWIYPNETIERFLDLPSLSILSFLGREI